MSLSTTKTSLSIPGKLNLFLAFCSMAIAAILLFLASHAEKLWIIITCVFFFGFIANTIFSLLHEAVHFNFHSNKKINYIFGNILAAFFPTAFTFQQHCHLNHHRNNRTEYEHFESYVEGENKFVRTIMLYIILTGVYWIIPILGSIWLLISPKTLFRSQFSGKQKNNLGDSTGSASMLRSFANFSLKKINTMRIEVVFVLFFQFLLFYLLDLNFVAWISCYFWFGLLWSTLQYADHAYSPNDIRNGAWNLKVNPISKLIFLNYHDHLAHHQNPNVPWIHLPHYVKKNEKSPSFWSIYLRMWKGLEKVDRVAPKRLDPEFELILKGEN